MRKWMLVLQVFFCFLLTSAHAEKRLNNLVVELINEQNVANKMYTLSLPRPGWIFIQSDRQGDASATLTGAKLTFANVDGKSETMRHLPAGDHPLAITGTMKSLIVRRIPEIRFANYPADPWVWRFGPYDWEFLSRHILPNLTTLVAQATPDLAEKATAWRASGKQWMIEAIAPGLNDSKKPIDAAKVLAEFGSSETLGREWVDGAMIDEYYPSVHHVLEPTLAALKASAQDPKLAKKLLEPYVAGEAAGMTDFVRQAIESGHRVAFERYNCEQPTEAAAKTYLHDRMAKYLDIYAKAIPDIQQHVVIALGFMSGPPETLNTCPSASYRVFQDMEFQLLANDPRFEELAGVMFYTSSYAEEETIRWSGKLLRHYCIEGSRERMSIEPYALDHLQNADFEQGLADWNAAPAAADSIVAKTVADLGDKEGRFGADKAGDTCAVMIRSDNAPNRLSQTVKNLKPGKTYALRMYSTSLNEDHSHYGNPTFDDVTRLRIQIDGVDVDAAKSFDHIYRSIHTAKLMYFNYHFRIFKPHGETATLTLSDWTTDTTPGGNIGRTTAVNFVEVMPYFEDEQKLP